MSASGQHPLPYDRRVTSTPRRRILVVDDEPALLALYSEVLSGEGFAVTACRSGGEALACLEREVFDAALSDISMPGLDGMGLLRALRARGLDLPVVLVTGAPSLNTAIEAIEHGALQYLVKPVAIEALVGAAARAVRLGAMARLRREARTAVEGRQGLELLDLEAAFGRALEGLLLLGQPIVGQRLEPYAHEALVRSREPLLPGPGELLEAAERLRRLPDLGRAIRRLGADLVSQGSVPGLLFVNLHPLDLADDDLVSPGAPLSAVADRVVLEVTERARLDAVPRVGERIAQLRSLGFRIALDDLGAGYAGLNTFAALAPDFVKLDMELVRGSDRDPLKRKLIQSMAGLCREMDMKVVAEGIETVAEREVVVQAGCELLQGFLIARPAPFASGVLAAFPADR
jgi:EAL domain-containing protein (putative c-di-GMP-specific phosphodiesterase class I)/ActR/RegA family two-component response regulator